MAKKKSLDRIFDSKASLTEDKTRIIISQISTKADDWVCYGGAWTSMLVEFVETYINQHACIPGVLGNVYTSDPLHVGRIVGDDEWGRVDLLLFGNGAVVVQSKTAQDRFIYLWIDKKTIELFGYPKSNEHFEA